MGHFNDTFEDRLKLKNIYYIYICIWCEINQEHLFSIIYASVIHLDKSSDMPTLIMHLGMCRKFTMVKLD